SSSFSNAVQADSTEGGNIAGRSDSGNRAGSTVISGGSVPEAAAESARTAPTTRYGFALPPTHFSSALAACGSDPVMPVTRRRAASRFSRPQQRNGPAQRDGTRRSLLATLGALMADRAG